MAQNKNNNKKILPSLIVFDLDDCLWSPEMHELPGIPEIPIYGDLTMDDDDENAYDSKNEKPKKVPKLVVGLQVARYKHSVVRLFHGARRALYEVATNPIYIQHNVLLATASSSLEPSYSYACLEGLEILPNVTMADLMCCNQIGRTGKLSPSKLTHFREIHNETGIPYHEMLFFDVSTNTIPKESDKRFDTMVGNKTGITFWFHGKQ